MGSRKWVLVGMLLLPSVVRAQTSAVDLHGIYVYSSDIATISAGYSKTLTSSFSVPGIDGVVLVISWSSIEPAMGQYQWAMLDQWVGQAIALGKKIDLTVTAGIDTPSWVFQAAPGGAGAKPLSVTVSPHGGATGKCDSETVPAPWDSAFLGRWDSILAALAAHLKSVGTYSSITLLRLTGINRKDYRRVALAAGDRAKHGSSLCQRLRRDLAASGLSAVPTAAGVGQNHRLF
jgi:hypothetical protein